MKRILSLGLAVALALLAQENLHRRQIATDSAVLYLAAVVLFCWAAWRWPRTGARPVSEDPPRPARALTRWDWAVPCAALAPMAAAMVAWNANRFSGNQSTYSALIYLAGLGIFVYGIVSLGRAEGPAPADYLPVMSRRTELMAVGAISVLGAFMMFYRLDSLPFGVWYDESDSALEALQILNGAPYSPAAFHFRFNPSLYFEYVAAVFRLLGVGVLQIRIASTSLGLLAIPAVYVLARGLGGQRLALVAAFLMAVSRWHFDFARWGMFFVSSTAFNVLSIHFLLRALRYRRWSDFAWAGLMLGGGLHTYTAFRLVPAAAAVVAGYWVATQDLWPALRKAGAAGVAAEIRSLAPRALILVAVALVAMGPFALYSLQNPDVVNQRLDQASVFARKDTTAEKLSALGANVEKHLLMFNYRGDNNGRHNLPAEPMLDPTTGAFLVLGVGWSLWRWRDPKRVAVLLWLAVAMLGGILSLDFEAPQAVRTLIAVPAVCLLAAWPLTHVWESAREFARSWVASRRGLRLATAAACLLLTVALGRAAYSNWFTYFVRQANDYAVWSAYSTAETITARRAGELGEGYSYYLANFLADHPTIRFLAPWLKAYQVVTSDMIFPLYRTGEKPVAIFLDAQKTAAFNAARRYYPTGSFVQHAPPFGGPPVLFEIVLKPSDIQAVQGLNASYYQGTIWQGKPVIQRKEPRAEADWRTSPPLVGAFSAEWQGTLYAPLYGQYTFAASLPAAGQLLIDESAVLELSSQGGSAEKSVALAKGNHSLRLRVTGAQGQVRLAWQPPGGARETIPQESLYVPPVLANGLLGSYYRGPEWAGAPAIAQVDPSLSLYFHQPLLPRPYTVEWRGKLDAPAEGSYTFGLESIDDSWLYIDEKPITEAHVHNQLAEGKVTLTAGLHDIRVRFLDKSGYSHINLYWMPPGRGREPVPSERLLPPQGAYPTPLPAAVPPMATPAPRPTPAVPAGSVKAPLLRPIAVIGAPGSGAAELAEPRDVAVNSKGDLYVADTGNRRVQVLAAGGSPKAELPGDLQEPLALVVDPRDNVYVLDSEPGWIHRYDNSGAATGRFGGPGIQAYHPRGLGIDGDGNLYVVDTGGGRIIKLSPDGTVVARIGSRGSGPGQFLEPVDVVFDSAGQMYVADVGNRRIVHLDAGGVYVREWLIPQSVAYNGVHLALDGAGRLYATNPEAGRLLVYDTAGRLLLELGQRGSGEGEFLMPVGVFAGADGRVYVAEVGNGRIQVLGL